jgi:hypothetical protein
MTDAFKAGLPNAGLCVAGVISLIAGVAVLFGTDLTIVGPALIGAGFAALLRSMFGGAGFPRSQLAYIAGLLIGGALATAVDMQPAEFPGPAGAVAAFLLFAGILWFAFSVGRDTVNKYLVRAGAAIAALALLYVWSPALWFKVTPLLLPLIGLALYRAGLPVGGLRRAGSVSTAAVVLGLLCGAGAAALWGSFDLRQRCAALFCSDVRSFRFQLPASVSDPAQVGKTMSILRRRLDPDAHGLVRVTAVGDRTVSVGVDRRWADDPNLEDFIRSRCEPRGVLEFRILAARSLDDPEIIGLPGDEFGEPVSNYATELAQDGPRAAPQGRCRWFRIAAPDVEKYTDAWSRLVVDEYEGDGYVLAYTTPDRVMLRDGSWSIRRAEPTRDTADNPSVSFTLDTPGGEKLAALTSGNLGRPLAVLLDDEVIFYANIQETIRTQCRITGTLSPEEVTQLSQTLTSDPLPAPLEFVEESPFADDR